LNFQNCTTSAKCFVIFVGGLLAFAVRAEIIDIQWNAQQRFTHEALIAPGKLVEVCGQVKKGEVVAWRYDSPVALDFNIHYHLTDKSVVYPVREPKTAAAQGRLRAESDQDYCWMWTNPAAQAVQLTLLLQREP
jgi:hypothetical protein